MPYFGVHQSIASGFDAAVYDAAAMGYDCVQIFSGNSNRWSNKAISPEAAQKFQSALSATGQRFPLIHDSYLINLASSDEPLHEKSVARFTEELSRAQTLGVRYVVMHPGAFKGDTRENGLSRVSKTFDAIFETSPQITTEVLIETTAGQGTYLGGTFEEIATIIAHCDHKDRLGVCLDTCHVFAAGYDFRTRETYDAMFDQFSNVIGLDLLRAFHLNDSMKPLGSHADRHDHIGQGAIGLDAFAMLVTDPRFSETPMYLETPKKATDDGQLWDVVNLQTLKSLL